MKKTSQTIAANRQQDDAEVENPADRADRGKKRHGEWLDDELRRQYKSVLDEPVPDSLLSILRESDDEADDAEGAPARDGSVGGGGPTER